MKPLSMLVSVMLFVTMGFATVRSQEVKPATEVLPDRATDGAIRVLLIGGGSSHDFEKFFHEADSVTLRAAGRIVTAYANRADAAIPEMEKADVLVLSANDGQFGGEPFQKALNAFADRGRGVVIVHAATWYNWAGAPEYNRRFVGGGTRSHGHGEFTVFNRQSRHPVMKGIDASFKIIDEHYRVMLDAQAPVEILAETDVEPETKQGYPSVWVVKDPKARIVDIALGHGTEAHGSHDYQTLLINAVRWTHKTGRK